MKQLFSAVFALALVAGCAEQSLLKRESAVDSVSVTSRSNLKTLGAYSAELSAAYREAAREAQKGQDLAAVVTFLAAASFVSGAAAGASNAVLADRALVGVGSTNLSGRTVSRDAIEGIYSSAKRMNCVATTSRMGGFLLDPTQASIKGMARAATFGAIEEIKIIAREALVRDVADFTQIRDDLIDGSILSDEQMAGFRTLGTDEDTMSEQLVVLNQYLKLLDNCLGAETSVTAVEAIDQQNG